ncbi:ComEC/Rec2 family competence protein [Specibacter sp. RAF43]|uniref:ComEC/Rec2 family competence protein n=1 Tax=Specibacter sp. RAF43 TaxID=3233057 RepID=UPI003F9C8E4A
MDLRLVPAAIAAWSTAAAATAWPWRQSMWCAGIFLCTASLAGLALRRGGSPRPGRNSIRSRRSPHRDRIRPRRSPDRGPIRSRRGAKAPADPILAGVGGAVVVAAACAGMICVAAGLHQFDRARSPLDAMLRGGAAVTVVLRMESAPRPLTASGGGPQVIFEAEILSATSGGRVAHGRAPVRVVAGIPWAGVAEGATVSTAGRLSPGGPEERVLGYLHPLTAPLPPAGLELSGRGVVQGLRSGWVDAAHGAWNGASPDAGALLPGMVMGDRSGVDPGLEAAMTTVGLTHLTAVSGANCTLVLAALLSILRTARLPRLAATAGAGLGLAGFVAVVGPDPSVLRAAVMGGIGALAMVGGRPKRVGALLSVTIVGLLVFDPWLARDVAFALSVLATLGLHLVGRRCARWLGAWLPAWMAQAVAIPLAAQLFCAPLIVLLQPRLTLFTVPANMVVAPVVGLVTTVGTFGLVTATLVPALAMACAAVAGIGAWWVAAVARWMATLPGAVLPWPGGAAGVVLMAVFNALVLAALVAAVERQRTVELMDHLRETVPRRWHFLFGFGALTACVAVAAGAWTWAAL